MKALCQICFTSNIECVLWGTKTMCLDCKAKNKELLPTGMKYPSKDRFKERWDEKT